VSRGIRQRRGMNFIGNSYMDWQEKGKEFLSRKGRKGR
jgi:spore maturation protein CgeB